MKPALATAALIAVLLMFLLAVLAVVPAPAQVRHLKERNEESSMTYRMVHPLHRIASTSKDVVYDLEADTGTKEFKRVAGWVDVTTFDSGNSNRDSHAMEVIDAIDYPDAEFEGTGFVQKGDSLIITGKITFHGVTREITSGAVSRWSEGRLEVDGSFDLSLAAFNIERPSLLMIPVEDRLSFSFVAVFGLE
jgi:polyisoprenoid-binding protein YceI